MDSVQKKEEDEGFAALFNEFTAKSSSLEADSGSDSDEGSSVLKENLKAVQGVRKPSLAEEKHIHLEPSQLEGQDSDGELASTDTIELEDPRHGNVNPIKGKKATCEVKNRCATEDASQQQSHTPSVSSPAVEPLQGTNEYVDGPNGEVPGDDVASDQTVEIGAVDASIVGEYRTASMLSGSVDKPRKDSRASSDEARSFARNYEKQAEGENAVTTNKLGVARVGRHERRTESALQNRDSESRIGAGGKEDAPVDVEHVTADKPITVVDRKKLVATKQMEGVQVSDGRMDPLSNQGSLPEDPRPDSRVGRPLQAVPKHLSSPVTSSRSSGQTSPSSSMSSSANVTPASSPVTILQSSASTSTPRVRPKPEKPVLRERSGRKRKNSLDSEFVTNFPVKKERAKSTTPRPRTNKERARTSKGKPPMPQHRLKGKPRPKVERPGITFEAGFRLDAMDFQNRWYQARIVEVAEEEQMILVHFDKWNSRWDIWVDCESDRIRPLRSKVKLKAKRKAKHVVRRQELLAPAPVTPQPPPPQQQQTPPQQPEKPPELVGEFKYGEEVLARWSDCRYYPAKVLSYNKNGTYRMLFYDGIEKSVLGTNTRAMPEELKTQNFFSNFNLPPAPVVKGKKRWTARDQSIPEKTEQASTSTPLSSPTPVPPASEPPGPTSPTRTTTRRLSGSAAPLSPQVVPPKKTKLEEMVKSPKQKVPTPTLPEAPPVPPLTVTVTPDVKPAAEPAFSPVLSPVLSPAKREELISRNIKEPLLNDKALGLLKERPRQLVAPKELVIDLDHNKYKCNHKNCDKSFRKQGLLEYHKKYYHVGKTRTSTAAIRVLSRTKKIIKGSGKLPSKVSPHKRLSAPPELVSRHPSRPEDRTIVKRKHPASVPRRRQSQSPPPVGQRSRQRHQSEPIFPGDQESTTPSTAETPTERTPTLERVVEDVTAADVVEPSPAEDKKVVTPSIKESDRTGDADREGQNGSKEEGIARKDEPLPQQVAAEQVASKKPGKGVTAAEQVAPKKLGRGDTKIAASATPKRLDHPEMGKVRRRGSKEGWTVQKSGDDYRVVPREKSRQKKVKGLVSRGSRGIMSALMEACLIAEGKEGHRQRHKHKKSKDGSGSRRKHQKRKKDRRKDGETGTEKEGPGDEQPQPATKRKRRPPVSRGVFKQPHSRVSLRHSGARPLTGVDNEIIKCVCKVTKEDGFMVQCETCFCWQHSVCVGLSVLTVPKQYMCYYCQVAQGCKPRLYDQEDYAWYEKGQLPMMPSFSKGVQRKEDSRAAALRQTTNGLLADVITLVEILQGVQQKIAILQDPNHPEAKLWAQDWILRSQKEGTNNPKSHSGTRTVSSSRNQFGMDVGMTPGTPLGKPPGKGVMTQDELEQKRRVKVDSEEALSRSGSNVDLVASGTCKFATVNVDKGAGSTENVTSEPSSGDQIRTDESSLAAVTDTAKTDSAPAESGMEVEERTTTVAMSSANVVLSGKSKSSQTVNGAPSKGQEIKGKNLPKPNTIIATDMSAGSDSRAGRGMTCPTKASLELPCTAEDHKETGTSSVSSSQFNSPSLQMQGTLHGKMPAEWATGPTAEHNYVANRPVMRVQTTRIGQPKTTFARPGESEKEEADSSPSAKTEDGDGETSGGTAGNNGEDMEVDVDTIQGQTVDGVASRTTPAAEREHMDVDTPKLEATEDDLRSEVSGHEPSIKLSQAYLLRHINTMHNQLSERLTLIEMEVEKLEKMFATATSEWGAASDDATAMRKKMRVLLGDLQKIENIVSLQE